MDIILEGIKDVTVIGKAEVVPTNRDFSVDGIPYDSEELLKEQMEVSHGNK
jgi:hypothetical protein